MLYFEEQDGLEISGYLHIQLGSILHSCSHLWLHLELLMVSWSFVSPALRKPAETQAGHRKVDGAGSLPVFWIWIFLLSQRHNSLRVKFRFRNPFTATEPRPTIPDITPCYYQKAMKCIYDAVGNQQKRTTLIPRSVARGRPAPHIIHQALWILNRRCKASLRSWTPGTFSALKLVESSQLF